MEQAVKQGEGIARSVYAAGATLAKKKTYGSTTSTIQVDQLRYRLIEEMRDTVTRCALSTEFLRTIGHWQCRQPLFTWLRHLRVRLPPGQVADIDAYRKVRM